MPLPWLRNPLKNLRMRSIFHRSSSSFHSASNEMLAAVLDQSADCIKVIGPEGTLDFMNRNGRCAMGIDDFALVAGKYWWELWPQEAEPQIRAAIADAHEGRNSRFQAFCPTGKGEPRWWDVSVSPMRDETGELIGLISVSRRYFRRSCGPPVARNHRGRNAPSPAERLCADQRDRADQRAWQSRTGGRSRARSSSGCNGSGSLSRCCSIPAASERRPGYPGAPPDRAVSAIPRPSTLPRCPMPRLDETQVRALALVLGEFSTNSNKYGALGNGGNIAIRGSITDGVLTLQWSETTDVPVAAHERDGSAGLELIRRTLAAHNGSLDIAWRRERSRNHRGDARDFEQEKGRRIAPPALRSFIACNSLAAVAHEHQQELEHVDEVEIEAERAHDRRPCRPSRCPAPGSTCS